MVSSTSRCAGQMSAKYTGCAVFPLANGILAQVEIDASGQRKSHHQRRRHQIVGTDFRVDAPLEIAIAGKHRGHDQILSRR